MKLILLTLFLSLAISGSAQFSTVQSAAETAAIANGPGFSLQRAPLPADEKRKKEIRVSQGKWKVSNNHLWTGGLVFLAGAAKGFNETLHFHWKEFKRQFPGANDRWFNPSVSWKNKYRNNDPEAGPKFFGSTSVLIMFTDQYHLNNFINRASWGTALVIKIGEGKKPFKHYLLDLLYYGACHQAGFAATYYPFSKYRGK